MWSSGRGRIMETSCCGKCSNFLVYCNRCKIRGTYHEKEDKEKAACLDTFVLGIPVEFEEIEEETMDCCYKCEHFRMYDIGLRSGYICCCCQLLNTGEPYSDFLNDINIINCDSKISEQCPIYKKGNKL